MTRFFYTYRSTDGKRHSSELEASSRDEVYRLLRAKGIRPIRVSENQHDVPSAPTSPTERTLAAPSSRDESVSSPGSSQTHTTQKSMWCLVGILFVAGLVAFFLGRHFSRTSEVFISTLPTGVTLTSQISEPLARQVIPGNRALLTLYPTNLFTHPLEFYLARYAEPGRPVDAKPITLSDSDAREILKHAIRINPTDRTEFIDLKRIVSGMKQEMRAYLMGGGTVQGYLDELQKRQEKECAYRTRAQVKLEKLLTPPKDAPLALDEAYTYFLKANAQLRALGIWELPLPDTLRTYQQQLELDDDAHD